MITDGGGWRLTVRRRLAMLRKREDMIDRLTGGDHHGARCIMYCDTVVLRKPLLCHPKCACEALCQRMLLPTTRCHLTSTNFAAVDTDYQALVALSYATNVLFISSAMRMLPNVYNCRARSAVRTPAHNSTPLMSLKHLAQSASRTLHSFTYDLCYRSNSSDDRTQVSTLSW